MTVHRLAESSLVIGATSPAQNLIPAALRYHQLPPHPDGSTSSNIFKQWAASQPVVLLGGETMEVLYERCAGLDVHKKTVVAHVITLEAAATRTFSTMTKDLLALADWL